MKKITPILFFLFGVTVYAQNITITQNNDPNNVTSSSVACRVGPNEVNESEGLFEGMYFDNYFARAFDLQNDHDIDSDFMITSIEIGQGFGRNIQLEVNIYTSNTEDLTDPNLDLVLVDSEDVFVITQGNQTVLFIPTNVMIPVGEIVVVEVHAPNSGDATNEEFFIGINSAGHSKPAYLKAPASFCGVPSYIDSSNLGAGQQQYIINIIGQESLSINQAKLDQIEIFPNPVSDKINLKLPAGLILERASVTDMNGKLYTAHFIDGEMDMSNFSTGQYLLTLQTSAGNHTHKIIKK